MSAASPWVFVSGCDSGFGQLLVNKLSKEHNQKVFAGLFDPKSAALYEGNPHVVTLVMDVTNDESVESGFRFIRSYLQQHDGVLAGVVNNAGLLRGCGPVEFMPVDYLRAMNAVNVEGTARVCKAAIPLLRESPNARIVNMASLLGRIGSPYQAYYSATKFAVTGLTEALAREVAQFGIHVVAIEPGVFPGTGLFNTYKEGLDALWVQQTPEVKAAYGEEWKDETVERLANVLSERGNTDTSLVPTAVTHALLAPQPLYRYRVGWDSKLLLILPSAIIDSRLRGLPRPKTANPTDAAFKSKLPYALTALGSLALLAKL